VELSVRKRAMLILNWRVCKGAETGCQIRDTACAWISRPCVMRGRGIFKGPWWKGGNAAGLTLSFYCNIPLSLRLGVEPGVRDSW
jgi:hypothetical protein